MTFPVPASILHLDPITTSRPNAGADSEGIPEGGYTAVYAGRGTLGTPTAADLADAAVRMTHVDQVLALPLSVDIKDEDTVVCSRGTFVVVSVSTRRLYLRAILRKIST
jgi:hypothetical protein